MGHERLGLMSLREAMDLLGVSRATFDRWRKEKRLPYIKIGKEIWVDQEQLQEWVRLHGQSRPFEPSPSLRPPPRRVVRVGYQSGAALLWSTLVIKKLGLFEEELGRLSPTGECEVVWQDAPNGMELVEELILGRVHIASIGDYPIMTAMALSRILPRFNPLFLAFDGKTGAGEGISLVVPARGAASGLDRPGERPVLTVGQSSASVRLREWLHASGGEPAPIVSRRTMVDCYHGIVMGQAEASVMWEPYLSWVQATGAGIPVSGEGPGSDYLTGLLTERSWAAENEDVVIAYLKAHLRAHDYMRKEPAAAAEIVSAASGFPAALAEEVLSRIRWDASTYGRDLQTLLRLSDGRDGLPAEGNGSDAAFVSGGTYLQHAAEALKLPQLPDAPLPGDWSRETPY